MCLQGYGRFGLVQYLSLGSSCLLHYNLGLLYVLKYTYILESGWKL